MDEFNRKAAGLDNITGLVGNELVTIQLLMLLQFELDQTEGKRRGMDGGVDCLQHIGQSADMVFMSVRNKEAAKLLLIFYEIGNVGNDEIDAVHIVLGKTEAAVNNDHILSVLQNGHVFSDFIQTAQRNNFQFICQLMTTPFDISKSKYVDVPNGRNAADPAEKMIAPYIMERRKKPPVPAQKTELLYLRIL